MSKGCTIFCRTHFTKGNNDGLVSLSRLDKMASWKTPSSLVTLPKDAMYYARSDTAFQDGYTSFKAAKAKNAKARTKLPSAGQAAWVAPAASLQDAVCHTHNGVWRDTYKALCSSWRQQADNKQAPGRPDKKEVDGVAAAHHRAAVAEAKRLHSAVLLVQQQQQHKKASEERRAQLEAASVLSMLGAARGGGCLGESSPAAVCDRELSSRGAWDSEDETTSDSGSDICSSRKRPLQGCQEEPVAKQSRPVLAAAVAPQHLTECGSASPAATKLVHVPSWAAHVPIGSWFVTSASQWVLPGVVQQTKGGSTQQDATCSSQQQKSRRKKPEIRQISWATPMSLR